VIGRFIGELLAAVRPDMRKVLIGTQRAQQFG
jgi:hypothetical protein